MELSNRLALAYGRSTFCGVGVTFKVRSLAANYLAFRVTEMRETYCRALRTLAKRKENIFRDKRTKDPMGANEEIEAIMLSLFTSACDFELQAGRVLYY